MSQNPNLFSSVGKQVKDEYGRIIGKIVSFAVTPSGKFDGVFVQQGDGKFTKHSVEHLKADGADVMIMSKAKSEVSALCDQIPLIWRRDQAIKDLFEKKKIPPDFFNELHTNFDGVLTQLKTEAQALGEEIDEEAARCADEIKSLNLALVNLEIEHEIGKIDNQSYETAFKIIQENLKQVHAEKNDLEITKSKLSNILLGDKLEKIEQTITKAKEASKGTATVHTTPELPEPPVVVYVKEVGKTGI